MKSLLRDAGTRGPVRLHRRTKELLHQLRPGEVAVIDHPNLDRVAADGLVDRGAAAVLNAASSCCGEFPNRGPARLLAAGVPHLDRLGSPLFDELQDGDVVSIRHEAVFHGQRLLGWGRVWTAARLKRAEQRAYSAYRATFRQFIRNTVDHVLEDLEHFPEPLPAPASEGGLKAMAAVASNRPALVVARGPGHRRDLPRVLAQVEDLDPVIVAVDGAADALLRLGVRPHIIVGDMDSVSDESLCQCRHRLVHAYPGGEAPGLNRLKKMGLTAEVLAAPGTSEDLALMVAHHWSARPIITVGSHRHPIDFLEKGRHGMGSTVLTRMALGPSMVDLSGVGRLDPGDARPAARRGPWQAPRLSAAARRWSVTAAAVFLLAVPIAGLAAVTPVWQNLLRFGMLYLRVVVTAPF